MSIHDIRITPTKIFLYENVINGQHRINLTLSHTALSAFPETKINTHHLLNNSGTALQANSSSAMNLKAMDQKAGDDEEEELNDEDIGEDGDNGNFEDEDPEEESEESEEDDELIGGEVEGEDNHEPEFDDDEDVDEFDDEDEFDEEYDEDEFDEGDDEFENDDLDLVEGDEDDDES